MKPTEMEGGAREKPAEKATYIQRRNNFEICLGTGQHVPEGCLATNLLLQAAASS